MKVDGACHCGAISYEAEVNPETVGICHCTDCQALTGSAFRVTARADAQTFRLTGGPPTIYVKTADSGAKRAHAFCPGCGSPIYATAAAGAAPYSLRVGALRQRAALIPRRQIWCDSALPWVADLGAVARTARQ